MNSSSVGPIDPEHAAPKGANETLLAPCPFCGGDEISHGWQDVGMDEQGVVQCHGCGAAILADFEDEAIAAWNRRSQEQTPPSLEVMPEGLTDGLAQDEPLWRPIESAPRDGTDVLLWGVHRLDGQRQFVGGWWPAEEDWATEDGALIRFEPTHWMPLPSPPKETV